MAFPTIVTQTESSTNTAGTSHTMTLPSSLVVGNIIVIICNKGTGTTPTFNALEGWTEIVDEAVVNGMTVWARQINGSEGASVVFTSSVNTRSAEIAYQISGAELLTVRPPELSTVATGTSTAPDATTCTPTGGAKDYLWISFFGMAGEEADDDTWVNTPPTNFLPNPPTQKSCGTAGTTLGGLIGAATRSVNASTQDAAAFAVDVSAAWRAYTLAVHPVAAQAPPITVTMPTRIST